MPYSITEQVVPTLTQKLLFLSNGLLEVTQVFFVCLFVCFLRLWKWEAFLAEKRSAEWDGQ